MKKILLSIKPEYVQEILEGRKKYEYRRVVFKDRSVHRLLIYSSSPIRKIVAECEIVNVFKDNPASLWDRTKAYSGISKVFFDNYFSGCQMAYAIELGHIEILACPRRLMDYGIKRAPQSFMYLYQ